MHARGMMDEQHDVAEDAVAAAPIGFRVMPRWADECVRVLRAAEQHRIDGLDAAARREQRDLVAAGADDDALADRSAAGRGYTAHGFYVALAVEIAQLLDSSGTRAHAQQVIG